MKKIISLILIMSMLVATLTGAIFVSGEEYDSSKVFIDVPSDSWFRGSVDFVASRGIMGGAGNANTFKPADLSTRSMVAVILHRLEGEPAAVKKSPFTDLSQDWYVAAADWAYETGVVKGSSDTTFNPDGKVTRQELVTMLYRYAKFCGLGVTEKMSVDTFVDGAEVASWALESVEWGLGAGLINGRVNGGNTLLAPMGNTQRSEMATILSRFITRLESAENTVDPLFAKADALKETKTCATHKAAIHFQLGAPSGVGEAEISAMLVSALGLDPSIYYATLGNGGFDAFVKAYSKVNNGDFVTIPVTFELNNLRTVDDPVKFSSLPVAVRRNDWYAVPAVIDCDAEGITDEALNLELEEFDSLYVCREHGYVHLEAASLSDTSLADALLALIGRSTSSYKIYFDSTHFNALKAEFDKLASGKSTSVHDVKLTVNNENIKKECGYEATSISINVKLSVLKSAGTTCKAVECPYDVAIKATELFLDKYVCNEHGKAHVALKTGATAKLADMESLMKATLDLGPSFTVKLDSTAFNSGKIKVKLTHQKGYEVDGPSFTAVYTTDSTSSVAAKFTLCENERDAYKLIVHDGYAGNTGYGAWNHGQTESGWLLDTRADDSVRHGIINDVSTTEASQVIREVNNTTKGVLNLRGGVEIKSGFDGAMLDFRNADGDSIFRLQTKGGAWKLLQKDGSYKTVYEPAGKTKFVFDLKLDLYAETATIIINDENCGTYPLSATGVNVNVQNFRFASTDEDKVTFAMDICDASVNYSLWEYFGAHHFYGTLPAGWEYQNASLSPNTGFLSDAKLFDHYLGIGAGGNVKKSFDPVSGKVIVQFSILPAVSGSNTEFTVLGGGSELVKVKTDEKSFYVNGKKAYDYAKNVWYYFYLVCDTETGDVQLKINGIDRGTFTLTKKNVAFDTVKVTNPGTATTYDQFMVYNDVFHSDYVPEPVVPKGEEEYTVGTLTCSMWQNGFHGGWACITPYDDTRPVLGYYDEGTPETADWEIKYMVEHGIDFQSFVLFGIQETGPVTTGLGMHLEDGYKYAKYSDMLDYSLIWCSASPSSPKDMDAWKNYYVPYFIEYHFKDPRYLVLDNKVVLQTFNLMESKDCPYWTAEKRKEAFDYLDEEVKKLGFDGMLYITEEVSSSTLAAEGIDGLYSYSQREEGETFEALKAAILRQENDAQKAGLYYVPTSAVGFNCIAWMNERSPLMSVEEFKQSNEWIRDEYFATNNSTAPDWAKNLTIVATWNEYGEGHYIMPCEDLVGFGYLDVLRETFTSEKADESVNIRPTEAQLERINRLYPQHQKLIRAQEHATYTNGIYEEVPLRNVVSEWIDVIDLDTCVLGYADNITFENGIISNASGSAGTVTIKVDSHVDLSKCTYVGMRMYIPEGKGSPLNVGTGDHKNFKSMFSKLLTGTGAKDYYTVSVFPDLDEQIIRLTLPAGARLYDVKIAADARTYFPYKLNILGSEITYKVMPEMSPNGDYLFGFDTIFTDHHIFGMFSEWNEEAGTLRLSFPDNVFEFTVGSAFYQLNGTQHFLGYKLYETDGVPMIPLNIIAKQLGYTMDYSDFNNAFLLK